MPAVANTLSSISKSSVLCKADISIFKHNSVTLSSVLDFWKGKVGFQQYTCVANAGTTAVYTASGEVKANWNSRNSNNQNVHLPYVEQHSNVSLIMYRPENVPSALGATYNYKDVALHFNDADFDEVEEDSLWLLGRQQESYVAVRRACIGEINTLRACPTTGGQTWVIMVGDSAMYGSFAGFQDIVHQSQFEEKWYLDTITSQYVYYAKIVVDTATIDYAWGVDSTTSTGLTETDLTASEWNLYPNPANDMIQLNTANPMGLGLLEIFNVTGQLIHSQRVSDKTLSISTQTFSEGIYNVRLTNTFGATANKRLVITR